MLFFARDHRGATVIEYGLMAAPIVLAVVAGMGRDRDIRSRYVFKMLGIAVVALAD
jgi:Flp pilus assembly pilin Flp